MKHPTVYLIPFWGALPRHVEVYRRLWQELGLPVQVVQVSDRLGVLPQNLMVTWGQQIHHQICWNQPVLLHAFSNRVASALWALNQASHQFKLVAALVADSGPSYFFWPSVYGLLRNWWQWSPAKAYWGSLWGKIFWGWDWEKRLDEILNRVSVPALFLIAEQDQVIPGWCQQWVYEVYKGPKWRYSWAQGQHVRLYKQDPDEYRRQIRAFWNQLVSLDGLPD